MSKYKTIGNQTLFDAENAAQKLSEIGNPLEKLDSVIDFEMFRSRLEESMVNHSTKSNAGAKQYDVVITARDTMVYMADLNENADHWENYSFARYYGIESAAVDKGND